MLKYRYHFEIWTRFVSLNLDTALKSGQDMSAPEHSHINDAENDLTNEDSHINIVWVR
jgi:hypothetical protein